MSIDTEIQNMIQNTVDEQDFVCRLDAEQYTDDQIVGLEDQIAELVNQFEELESRTTSIELVKDSEQTQFFPTSETKFYVQNIRQELIASNDPHLTTLGLIMSDLQLFLLAQSMEPDGDQARTCKIFRAALESHQGLAADLQTAKDLGLEP
ncbi:hypothetical protein [Planktomarina sp.]|uniref:hypothetical protein n=1 Tax=Planktomarina sp. TaxID=2024851 RepID=UPI0032617782